MKKWLSLALACSFMTVASAAPQMVDPTAVWPDDRGAHVQAHGGGIIKLADTYYWFGEDRTETNAWGRRYVACYASTDLVHWKFRHQVVNTTDPDGLGLRWILERPKVYYSMSSIKVRHVYAH